MFRNFTGNIENSRIQPMYYTGLSFFFIFGNAKSRNLAEPVGEVQDRALFIQVADI